MSCVLYSFCFKKQEGKILGIHVALIDKSEIIHKMLLHCLYYYTVQVHRFNSLEECLKKFQDKKPNLIFIDWEVKQGDKPLIFTASEQFHPVPFVLLYRKDFENQLLSVPVKQVPYKIKKPLNPKEIRDICTKLVPELKNSALHSFLKFPKSEEEKKQEQAKPAPSPPKQRNRVEHQKKAEEKTKSFIGNLIEKTGLFKMPSSEEIEAAEEFPSSVDEDSLSAQLKKPARSGFQAETGLTSAPPSLSSKSESRAVQSPNPSQKSLVSSPSKAVKTNDITLIDTHTSPTEKTVSHNLGSLAKQFKESGSVTKGADKESSFDLNSKVLKTGNKPFNKEDINIDEDTQNDLAPMAMKDTAPSEKESELFTKQDFLQVFDKYKGSLEFQKLMEKALSEHVQDVVTGILKGASVKSVLKKPLEDFKESAQFKQLVEKEISQYLQKQLPVVIKSIVESEIRKIIGD